MLSGVYAGSAATIGIRSAAPTLAAALDAGAASLTDAGRRALPGSTRGPVFGAIEGGYQVLLDELVARSRLRWVQTSVTHIAPDGPGWSLRDDEGSHWHADGVIVAVPAPRLAPLLTEIAPAAAAAAARIPVASAAVLALAVPGGTPLPQQSGVLVASGERLRTKAITLSTRKWGARGNAELLRLSFGRFGDQVARDTSDTDLQAWALADLQDGVRHRRRSGRRSRAPLAGCDAAVRPRPPRADGRAADRPAAHAGDRGQLSRRHRGARLRGGGGQGCRSAWRTATMRE